MQSIASIDPSPKMTRYVVDCMGRKACLLSSHQIKTSIVATAVEMGFNVFTKKTKCRFSFFHVF